MSIFNFLKKSKKSKKSYRYAFTGFDYKQTATLQISTAYACIKVIAESIAMLPLQLYKEVNGEKQLATDHPLYELFSYAPNPNESPTEFKENLAVSLIMSGNAYCYIERKGLGNRITGLWVIPYQKMSVYQLTDGSIQYEWQDLEGNMQYANSFDKVKSIWHIKTFSTDGVKGISPIEQLKDTFAQAGMTDQFWTRFIENGCNLSGKLKIDDILDEETFNKLKERMQETYQGSNNLGKIMYLEQGMDFQPLTNNSLADSEYIETKKFIMKQIASIFKVPLYMIGIMEASTFNNVEQQQLFFLIHCLGPYLKKIEEKVIFLLDNGEDRSRFTAKFNTTSLLKMDMKSRFDVYKKAVEDGLFSPNECRAMEDMPSYIGGDVHLIPLNMGIVNEKGEIERIVDKNVDPNANTDAENSETEVTTDLPTDDTNKNDLTDEQQFAQNEAM